MIRAVAERSRRCELTEKVSEEAAVREAARGSPGEGDAVGIIPRAGELSPKFSKISRVCVRVAEHEELLWLITSSSVELLEAFRVITAARLHPCN